MHRSRSDLRENAEHFAQIDLDLSDFEKERNQDLHLFTVRKETAGRVAAGGVWGENFLILQ